VGIDVDGEDVGAGAGHRLGHGSTDPAPGTGDDDAAVTQPVPYAPLHPSWEQYWNRLRDSMRVVKMEAVPVAYPEPNDFDATRYLCLVKLTADDGQVGWGESITQFAEANAAVTALIDGLDELVVGADPVHTDVAWRRLKDRAWWYGYGGGLASYAIAAIDIALWDLKGKALGRSVCDLLGGPVHERLPAIASSHAHFESIPEMVEEAQGWLSTGLHGVKVGFGKRGNARLGYEHDRDVEYVRAMRDGLGPDKQLIIDLGIAIRWDVATAVRRVRAFEDYAIGWIEEPLGAWDPEGYATLRAKTETPIGYGEKEWTLEGFERVLATGTCDVVGCDPGRAEGITGFKRVADRVEAYRRQANAHAWSSAIVTAASLAISFSSPSFKVFEVKPLRNPMQHDLVTEPFEHRDGFVHPPVDKPGLGIEVIDEVVDRYRQRPAR
jgi:L-alanine-DL-glutamate epimerase-like enolase superfamily enzyme